MNWILDSKFGKSSGSDGLTLADIEQISRALNLHKILRSPSVRGTPLIGLFDKEKRCSTKCNLMPTSSDESGYGTTENERDCIKYSIIEKGIEINSVSHDKRMSKSVELDCSTEKRGKLVKSFSLNDMESVENEREDIKYTIIEHGVEINSVSHYARIPKSADLDCSTEKSKFDEEEKSIKTSLSEKGGKMLKSLSVNDMESVENEFVNMLGIEHTHSDFSSDKEQESPRERLLRQFEEEVLASGNSIFDFDDIGQQLKSADASADVCEGGDCSGHFAFPSTFQAAKDNDGVNHFLGSRWVTKTHENLEAEGIPQGLGLNQKDLHDSPCISSGEFGSPVYVSLVKPLK